MATKHRRKNKTKRSRKQKKSRKYKKKYSMKRKREDPDKSKKYDINDLPNEIIDRMIYSIRNDPESLIRFSQTSKKNYAIVKSFVNRNYIPNFYRAKNNHERYDILSEYIEMEDAYELEFVLYFYHKYVNLEENSTTLLDIAVLENNTEAIKILFNYGINKNYVNNENIDGNTPLMWAINRQNFENIILLLDNRANVNAKNKDGDTPLMFAVSTGDIDIVQLLLEYNPNVNDVNNENVTALAIAWSEQYTNIFRLLTQRGASVFVGNTIV